MCARESSSGVGKGMSIVNTAVKLRKEEYAFAIEFKEYVDSITCRQKQSRESYFIEAREALVRTGVISVDGKAKEKIVSWE